MKNDKKRDNKEIPPVVMYGCPVVTFNTTGTVRNEDGEAIEGAKIVLERGSGNNDEFITCAVAESKANGDFYISLRDYSLSDKKRLVTTKEGYLPNTTDIDNTPKANGQQLPMMGVGYEKIEIVLKKEEE